MIPDVPLGNFGNLMGLDGVFILGVPVLLAVGVILFVRLAARSGSSGSPGGAMEARLGRLDSMRATGAITEAEHQEQRRRILSET